MANVPNPRAFERAANARIDAMIEELVAKASDEAFGEFGGQLIRFNHRWHSIEPWTVVIEARITNAYFDTSDEGGRHLMFEVVVRVLHPSIGPCYINGSALDVIDEAR